MTIVPSANNADSGTCITLVLLLTRRMEPGADHSHEPPPQSRRRFVSVSRTLVSQLFGSGKDAFVDFHGTMPAAMACVIHVDPWGVRFDFERVSALRTSADNDAGHIVLHRACIENGPTLPRGDRTMQADRRKRAANRKVILFAGIIAIHANTVAQRRCFTISVRPIWPPP
jgi:hypothetical protein